MMHPAPPLLEQLQGQPRDARPGQFALPGVTLSWDLDALTVTARDSEPLRVALHAVTVQLSVTRRRPTTRRISRRAVERPQLVAVLRAPGLALQLDALACDTDLAGLPHLDHTPGHPVDLEPLVALLLAARANDATFARFAADELVAPSAVCIQDTRLRTAAAGLSWALGLMLVLATGGPILAVLRDVLPTAAVCLWGLRETDGHRGLARALRVAAVLVAGVLLMLQLPAFIAAPWTGKLGVFAVQCAGLLLTQGRVALELRPDGVELARGDERWSWSQPREVADVLLGSRGPAMHDGELLRACLETAAGRVAPARMLRQVAGGTVASATDAVRFVRRCPTAGGVAFGVAAAFAVTVGWLATWPLGSLDLTRSDGLDVVLELVLLTGLALGLGFLLPRLRPATWVIDPHRLALVDRRDWWFALPVAEAPLARIPAATFYANALGRSWRGCSLHHGRELVLDRDLRSTHASGFELTVPGLGGDRSLRVRPAPPQPQPFGAPDFDATVRCTNRDALLRAARELREELAPTLGWTLEIHDEVTS